MTSLTHALRASLLAGLFLCRLAAQTHPHRALLVISIDGMRPDYVSAADLHGLKIPNLRRIFTTGAHARGVRGVLPTVTYPSHTTLMTGVLPAKHGIYGNTTFDPAGKNQGGWYWYSDDVQVPELWEAVSKAGYVTGSVSWPVTVGARGIDWLVPEYWRASTSDDLKLIRALSTPGMMREFEPLIGPYETDLNNAIPGDWARTRYAEAIIRRKHARFLTVHLAALDHLEHASGPFSADSEAALEEIDRMVGTLQKAMRDQAPDAAICIVSDHGFAAIDHQLNLRVPFVKAGLITLTEGKNARREGLDGFTLGEWRLCLCNLKSSGRSQCPRCCSKAASRSCGGSVEWHRPHSGPRSHRVAGRRNERRVRGGHEARFFAGQRVGWPGGEGDQTGWHARICAVAPRNVGFVPDLRAAHPAKFRSGRNRHAKYRPNPRGLSGRITRYGGVAGFGSNWEFCGTRTLGERVGGVLSRT